MNQAAVRDAERMARLYAFFNKQDWFWRIEEWPEWVQRLALMKHKDSRARYRLFVFFTYNGLPRDLAVSWVKAADARPDGWLLWERYDVPAMNQLKKLEQEARTGELFEKCAMVMDMTKGYVVKR